MRFVRHQNLNIPHGSTIVWRYMSIEKFLDLLTHRRLFFTNAANFTDGYEVSLPPNIIKSKRKQLIEQGFSGRDLEEEIAVFEFNNRPMRDLTLVNCWSIGRHESYALWKIYLGGGKAGVAIRTNFSRVKKSIIAGNDPIPEDIYAGIVQYKDYLSENDLSRFSLITTKREFYEYEQELRLFILHYPRSEGGHKTPYSVSVGRYVKVDLDLMVDQIYLSPFVAQWFGDSLNHIVSKVSPQLVSRLTVSSIRDQ